MTTDITRRAVAQIYLRIAGKLLPDPLLGALLRATVDNSAHLPDAAVLEFDDPDFAVSDQDSLKIGSELQIELGSNEFRRKVFHGELVSIELDVNISGTMRMIVTAYDRAHRLTRSRNTRVYKEMSDSDIASQIGREAGLSVDADSTSEVHEYVLQDNQTDLEFLKHRAARVGYEVLVVAGRLIFKPPPADPGDSIELALTESLLSFRVRQSAAEQVSEVEVRGWDPGRKEAIVGTANRPDSRQSIMDSRTGGQIAAGAFADARRLSIVRESVHSVAQAQAIAQAALDELEGASLVAEGSATGDPRLRVGTLITMRGLGSRFSGTYLVSEARHIYEPAGYRNDFVAHGRRSTDIAAALGTTGATDRGLQLFHAIVVDNADPIGHGRVRVKLPTLGEAVESHWCRVLAPGAGIERGIEFIPEVDDEVLVIGDDLADLFVLGGLWNQLDAPPQSTASAVSGGKVERRVIKTRTGHTIAFDDSSAGGIEIVDSTGDNRIAIETHAGALVADVTGDIRIHAGGNLELRADGSITISATSELKADAGTNATIEAMAQAELSGSAAARIVSNGATEVKGPSVNIGP